MSSRKRQLREDALAYLLEHGLAEFSLRPMAAELGTSARILLFHFKSKEHLLEEVMDELNGHLQASFQKLSEPDKMGTPPLKRFWLWASKPTNLPYLKLLYEAQITASHGTEAQLRHVQQASAHWQAIALRSLSASLGNETMATLCIAIFDGLLIELINTGDRARLTRALDAFIAIAKA